MGWNPLKEAEKAAKRAIDKVVTPAVDAAKRAVESVGKGVRDGVRKVGREVEGGVKRVGREVEGGVKKVGHEVEGGVRKAGHEIEEGITEKLPALAEEAVREVIQAATAEAAKRAFDTAVDVVELFAPSSFGLKLGVELALVVQVEFEIAVEIPNPTARLTEIRQYAKHPPTGRSSDHRLREDVRAVLDLGQLRVLR